MLQQPCREEFALRMDMAAEQFTIDLAIVARYWVAT
jgi:hypothetical protein